MSGRGPLWARRLRWIIRGGADARIREVAGASAAIQRSILVAIADVCDDQGRVHEECELTAASLGVQCRCHEDTVRRALKALRDAGLLTAEVREGRSTRYALVIDHIERLEVTPHRWGGRAPRRAPEQPATPSHHATPSTVPPPASCNGEGQHRADPPSASCGSDPPQDASPLPYRIGEGREDREDRRIPPTPHSDPEPDGSGIGWSEEGEGELEERPHDDGVDQATDDEPPPSFEAPLAEAPTQLTLALVEPPRRDPVTAVFNAYVAARAARIEGGPKPLLTESRRKLIKARLKDGYSVEDLCAAVTGVFLREFNVSGKHYSLELVLRNGGQVEKYRAVVSDTDPNALRVRDFFGRAWSRRLGETYAPSDADLAAAARVWADAHRLATEHRLGEESVVRHWVAEFFDDPDRKLADARWPLAWLTRRIGTYGLPAPKPAAQPASQAGLHPGSATATAPSPPAPPPLPPTCEAAAHAAATLAALAGGRPPPLPQASKEIRP